jgi:hypothetical protein
MSSIANILYPVDFSHSCISMAAYVKRERRLCLGQRFHLFMSPVQAATTACNFK